MIIDLPPTVPIFNTQDANLAYNCVVKASKYYDVNPYAIQILLQTEGGIKGSKTLNKNGTYDYGPMQTNDRWVDELKRIQNINIDKNRLQNDVCYNIHIGTWILAYKISEVKGDVWKGLGNYHSKTEKYHTQYLKKAVKAYSQIVLHWNNQHKKYN